MSVPHARTLFRRLGWSDRFLFPLGIGCVIGQGFHFSPPVPTGQAAAFFTGRVSGEGMCSTARSCKGSRQRTTSRPGALFPAAPLPTANPCGPRAVLRSPPPESRTAHLAPVRALRPRFQQRTMDWQGSGKRLKI